jgi:hypothetical protein
MLGSAKMFPISATSSPRRIPHVEPVAAAERRHGERRCCRNSVMVMEFPASLVTTPASREELCRNLKRLDKVNIYEKRACNLLVKG